MNKNIENYYDTLDIIQTDDQFLIKQAYKKKIKQYHPDKNKDVDTTSIFLKIQKAYEILSDPKKKSEFDEKLSFFSNKKKFSVKRKSLFDALIKREKDALSHFNTTNSKNDFMNQKREREKENSSFNNPYINYPYKSYCAPKKKFCLKISYRNSIQIDFSKEVVKEYFSDFGIIDEIIMDKQFNCSFLTYKYESLLDNSIQKIKNDKTMNTLFNVEKFLYEHISIDNKHSDDDKKHNSDDDHSLHDSINTQKILNSISQDKKFDFSQISLENFEKEIFK